MSLLHKLKTNPAVAGALGRIPRGPKARVRGWIDRWNQPRTPDKLLAQSSQQGDLLSRYVYEQAFLTPRFQDSKRLLAHGFKVYSQHDEDGMIEEIFRRIGSTDRYFVEFGVGDGLENCTSYLLLKGWSGAWIDGSAICYEGILKNMASFIGGGRLKARYSFITTANIGGLFAELGVPVEFDFLSIDIDRNDYWIWEALEQYRPRVVAIEYNASWKHTISCVVPYDANAVWDWTSYFGASLKALEILGRKKGYSLIGCAYTGVTAFFVRNDCLGDHFAPPYSSENHYEPPRFFVRMPNGHKPGFGPVVHIPE